LGDLLALLTLASCPAANTPAGSAAKSSNHAPRRVTAGGLAALAALPLAVAAAAGML